MDQRSHVIHGRSGRVWLAVVGVLGFVLGVAWLVTRPQDEAHALNPEAQAPLQEPHDSPVEIVDGHETRSVPLADEPESPLIAEGEASEDEYEEWNDHSWHELVTSHPPTELAGLVLRGKSPIADARIRLWGDVIGERPRGWGHDTPGARETRSNAYGSFLFTGLPAGTYAVRADDGDESMEVQQIKLEDNKKEPTVLVLFGRGTIEGSVHSDDGLALPGILVRIHGIGPLPSRSVFQHTDSDGKFRFTGLSSGRFHVIAEGRTDEKWVSNDQRMIRLEVEGYADVRFGNPEPPATVSARIVPHDPNEEHDRISLVHSERGDELRTQLDKAGGFEIQLAPGTWEVYERDGLFRGKWVGSMEVTAPRCDVTIRRAGAGKPIRGASETSAGQGSK